MGPGTPKPKTRNRRKVKKKAESSDPSDGPVSTDRRHQPTKRLASTGRRTKQDPEPPNSLDSDRAISASSRSNTKKRKLLSQGISKEESVLTDSSENNTSSLADLAPKPRNHNIFAIEMAKEASRP